MNRHERRAAAKQATPVPPAPAAEPLPQPPRPSLALRLFARVLLSDWVLKRVHHPDVITVLLQIAQQVGRSDVVARMTVALQTARH